MKQALLAAVCATLLSACGSSSAPETGPAGIDSLADGQGRAAPASGQSRAGESYDVFLTSASGKRIAFTVHEPALLTGGEVYPLILHGHGFSSSRAKAPTGMAGGASAFIPAGDVLFGDIRPFREANYGVISIDARGHGQSTGTVRVMDPDFEGQDYVQIVDWAEANLDWLAYKDGNLRLGAIGGSYGGGYQLLLLAVDPKRRLDAIVPQITWHDLSYSLAPGGVPKTGWLSVLLAAGNVGTGFAFDPELLALTDDVILRNELSPEAFAFLRYHSLKYFCDGETLPPFRPADTPPRVDALFMQGQHDVLFNLNEAHANFDCLSRAGGDVRLYTYQAGHVLPSGLGLVVPPPTSPSEAFSCGPFEELPLELAWFDAKLRDNEAALDGLPRQCLSLAARDGIEVDEIAVGGDAFQIPAGTVSLNVLGAVPVPRNLYTAEGEQVMAGIPTADIRIESVTGDPLLEALGETIVFIGLGRSRFGLPGVLELIDDQVRPVRGLGRHQIELNGIAERLNVGDSVQLLLYGFHPQFFGNGSRDLSTLLLRVSGEVKLPLLGPVPSLSAQP